MKTWYLPKHFVSLTKTKLNLIVGRENKYDKMKLFPTVSQLNARAVTAMSQSGSNTQLRHVRPSAGSQMIRNGQIFD
jgi:hypothetical protein